MSISDRLDQIKARAEAATLAQAETSLSMDGFDMREDYPEYGQGQLMNAYMLGYDEGCADKPALVAAVRAVLDVCEGLEEAHRANPTQMYEYGLEEAAHQVRNAIAAALGCGDGIDTTPERVHETPNREHIGEDTP